MSAPTQAQRQPTTTATTAATRGLPATTTAAGGVPASPPSPTSRWLATTSDVMPALDGPAGTAERLLLLVHYGVDWSGGWVGKYRATYWDKLLPDRVIVATYRSGGLRRWWRDVADDLGSAPRTAAERVELEELLRADPRPVLEVLRFETEALLLRTRIVADAVRAARVDVGGL